MIDLPSKKLIVRVTRSAVLWSYVATGFRVGSALILLPVVLFYLDEQELAFWYVLVAVGQMAYQLDFGFSQTLTRSAAYLWAGAPNLQSRGVIRASPELRKPNLEMMGDLIATFRLFYFVMAFGLVGVALLIGWPYINRLVRPGDPDFAYFAGAWLVYALAMGIYFTSMLWAAFLSGINQVQKGQQLLALGLVVNYAIVLLGLWLGIGVWSLVLGYLAMSLVVRGFGLWIVRRQLEKAGWDGGGRPRTTLIKTLWGNSWRTGVYSAGAMMTREGPVYLSGIFLPSAVTASLGIAMHMTRLVRQLAMIWVRVKMPWIQQKWVTNEISLLLKTFYSRVAIGTATYIAGALGIVILGPLLLEFTQSDVSMLPILPLGLLLVFFLIENFRSFFAQLVISTNVVPFWKSWILSGITAMVAGGWVARHYDLTVFLAAWFAIHGVWVLWQPVVEAMRITRAEGMAESAA